MNVPNPKNRVLSSERRLNSSNQRTSKFEGTSVMKNAIPNDGRDVARRAAELEKSRDKLAELVDSYISLLVDKKLAKNRSMSERERQSQVLEQLPTLASELNARNVEEGTFVLSAASLNSILVLRDEINVLRFQNHHLYKNMEKLTERMNELESRNATSFPEDVASPPEEDITPQ